MNFVDSLVILVLFAALALPGFIIKKFKMFPDNAVTVLVTILLFVAQPVLTFSSFTSMSYDPQIAFNMLLVVLFAIVVHLIVMIISLLALKPFGDSNSTRIATLIAFMGNCSFMGTPVIRAFFPDNSEPIMYTAVFSAVFNFMSWTFSVYILTRDKRFIKPRNALLNPPTIALLLALPLFFLSISLPSQLSRSLSYLGNMTAPLSMIILGIRLAEIRFKDLFNSTITYVSIFIKLIVFPLITFGLLKLTDNFLPLGNILFSTIFIMSTMPSAASAVALCEKFTPDSSVAVKGMSLSTLLSILTIPLLMMLL